MPNTYCSLRDACCRVNENPFATARGKDRNVHLTLKVGICTSYSQSGVGYQEKRWEGRSSVVHEPVNSILCNKHGEFLLANAVRRQ